MHFDQASYLDVEFPSLKINKPSSTQLWFYDGCDTNYIKINTSEKEDCECFFYIPNAFSPNGDGLNDSFLPKTNCQLISLKTEIYNRWGQCIYSSNEKHGWLGEGSLPNGAYICKFAAVISNGSREFHIYRSRGIWVRE